MKRIEKDVEKHRDEIDTKLDIEEHESIKELIIHLPKAEEVEEM